MTILLEINDFREYVKIPKGMNIEDFESYINLAQERFLKPILCEKTLEDLKTAYEAGNLAGNNLTLLNEIKPALVFRAYEAWIQDSSIIFTPNGLKVAEDGDGTSSPLESERRQAMISKAKSNAAFFENRLLAFLDMNKETYTDWKASPCRCKEANQGVYIHGVGANKSIKPLKIGIDQYGKRIES